MDRRKSVLAGLVCAIMVLSSAGIVGSAAQGDVPKGGTLRIGLLSEPDSLNPFIAQSAQSVEIFIAIYDYLFLLNETLEPRASLATSWTASSDHLTWTFEIADNATWSDGEKLTAADVKFTFEVIQNEDLTMLLDVVKDMGSITTNGDYELTITYETPVANVMDNLANVPVVPEHIWTGMTKSEILLFTNDNPVGSGAFTFSEWTKGSSLTLDANPDYWNGAPRVERVIYQTFANAETLVNALRNGEIDVIPRELPPASIKTLMGESDVKVAFMGDLYYRHICINGYASGNGNPTLRDVHVRQALTMATDKQALLDVVHLGYDSPGSTHIFKASSYWWNPIQMWPFDIVAANDLLNQSGYLDVDDDGVRESPDDSSIEMSYELMIISRWPEEMRTGQQLQTWWAQIGVELSIESADVNTILSKIYPDYSHDMYLWGFAGSVDPSFSLSVLLSDQVQNWNGAGYTNASYDALWEEQLHTIDPAARRAIVYQMQEIFYRDAVNIVLYYMDTTGAYRLDKFTGFVEMPCGVVSSYNAYTLRQVHLIYGTSTDGGGTDYLPWGIAVAGIAVALCAVTYALLKTRKTPKNE
jgi:peptide/nickel transport system substrate-binding protein